MVKTVDIFNKALALMDEDAGDGAEYKTNAVHVLNILLFEVFDVNNSIRRFKGLEPLWEVPQILEIDESELDIERELAFSALPYGMCEKFVYGEGDFSKIGYFNSLYVNGVNAAVRGTPGIVKDIY